MVIKRAGLKVVNNVLFLSKMTFECSSKTRFHTLTLTRRAPVQVLQIFLC